MIKFRLSTSLLIVAVVAIALGWYLDHNSSVWLTGTWVGPSTPNLLQLGYSTSLEIRENGTFTKVQRFGASTNTFTGNYSILDDGLVKFHATKLGYSSCSDGEPQESSIARTFLCRCAIDKSGILVIYQCSATLEIGEDPNIPFKFGPYSDISWEAYSRLNAE